MPATTTTTSASANPSAVIEQPVEPRDSDVVEAFDLTTRAFGRHRRFFRHRQVRGPGGDDQHSSEARLAPLRGAPRDATLMRVAGPWKSLRQRLGIRRIDARDHHVVASGRQALRDLQDLCSRLTLREDHLRQALTKRAVVVDLGEPEILVGHVPQLIERSADAPRTPANALEKPSDALRIQRASVIAGCAEAEKSPAQRRK